MVDDSLPVGRERGSEMLQLHDHWYTACASSRLGDRPRAARVLDADLVLFRGVEGSPFALLDRCRHRGAPLSLGSVVEGSLACAYHGWRYDGSGRCVHVPSLPAGSDLPGGISVPGYSCAEADGYVWVWMGRGSPAAPPGIPDFGGRAWIQGAIDYRCAARHVIENNLDWCHAAFTHEGTHPQYFFVKQHGFVEYAYEVRVTETGLVVFAPATDSDRAPIPDGAFAVIRFDLPNRVSVEFGGDVESRVVLHVVPTGEATCRLEWLYTDPSGAGSTLTWNDDEPLVFAQDRIVLEGAQAAYDREGGAFERSVEADASTLLVRRVLAIAERGEWEAKRSSLPQRRVVPVRA